MSHSRLRLWGLGMLVVLAFAGTAANVSALPILTPSGLNPGDTYQLVFVTSTTRDATSSDIAVYNTFVQSAANAANIGIGGRLGDVHWSAIASTSRVDARDNAFVFGPVYNLNDQIVAVSFADLWDGSLLTAIGYNELNDQISASVWTGTFPDGFGGPNYLGQAINFMFDGRSSSSGSAWIGASFTFSAATLKSLYALSEQLTVQSASVPEPATLMLFGSGLVGLLAWRARRRGQ